MPRYEGQRKPSDAVGDAHLLGHRLPFSRSPPCGRCAWNAPSIRFNRLEAALDWKLFDVEPDETRHWA